MKTDTMHMAFSTTSDFDAPEQRVVEQEAEKIYQALFRHPVPDPIIERFVDASLQCHRRLEDVDVGRYYRMVQRVDDLEALEIVCRHRRILPLLGLKFRLMVHLAETQPENQDHFVNEKTRLITGWWALVWGGFQTAFKFGKGLYLLKRIS